MLIFLKKHFIFIALLSRFSQSKLGIEIRTLFNYYTNFKLHQPSMRISSIIIVLEIIFLTVLHLVSGCENSID